MYDLASNFPKCWDHIIPDIFLFQYINILKTQIEQNIKILGCNRNCIKVKEARALN